MDYWYIINNFLLNVVQCIKIFLFWSVIACVALAVLVSWRKEILTQLVPTILKVCWKLVKAVLFHPFAWIFTAIYLFIRRRSSHQVEASHGNSDQQTTSTQPLASGRGETPPVVNNHSTFTAADVFEPPHSQPAQTTLAHTRDTSWHSSARTTHPNSDRSVPARFQQASADTRSNSETISPPEPFRSNYTSASSNEYPNVTITNPFKIVKGVRTAVPYRVGDRALIPGLFRNPENTWPECREADE